MNSSRPAWFPKWLSSVRAVMILLISLATIFPLGIILYQGFQHRTQAIIDSRTLSARLTAEVAFDQQLLLSSAKQLMSTFSYIPSIRRRDAVAVNALLADLVLKNPHITNLAVADEKGNFWASGLPLKAPLNVADRRYFRNALAAGRFSSGEFNIGRIRNKPAILFGYPLKDGSARITDVAIVSLSADQYERYFQSVGLATEGSLALLDHKGTVIFARPSTTPIGRQDRDDLFRKMTIGPDEGSFEAVGLTGIPRMFTYRKLRLPGESEPYMYVRSGISIEPILARNRKEFLIGMGLTAVAATLVLLLSVFLSKRFVLDKVAALKEVAERISRRDLTVRVPEVVSGGELGELGNAFDNMARMLQEADAGRQEAEKELRENEERFRNLFQSSRDALMTLEPPSWAFTSGNQATVEMFRVGSVKEFISYTPGDLSPERQLDGSVSAEKVKEMIEKAMREGSHFFEWTHKRIDGEEFIATVLLTRIETAGKQLLQATVRDITERKRAEEHVARLRRQNDLILRSAAEGILGLDLQGRHTFVNPAAARMLGYEAHELLGRPSHSIWHHTKPDGSPYPVEECKIYASYRKGTVHRVSNEVFWSKDGASFPVEYMSTPIYEHGSVAGAVLTFADITERKQAEEELRFSRQLLELHVQQTPLAVVQFNIEGRVRDWNPAAAKVFGYSPEEAIGQHWKFMAPETAWNQLEGVWEELLSRRGGSRSTNENRTKDGRMINCLWFNTTLADPEGRAVGVASLVLDITEREQAEREKEKLQAQLQQAMKMEAVGRLAGGVAHDFNNLLTVITGYSELLLLKIGKESTMHGEVEEIQRAGERAASLTRQLLAFSRKQIVEPKVVHLDRLVAEMHKMLTRLIGEDISLQATTGKSMGSVKIDPVQFQQILMNLVVNARDAMPGGGKIVIETANVDLEQGYCALHPYVKPGRYVMLAVSDSGVGMSKEVKAHIFEPFFTTKETGSGTGLGLATTYGAVHQAGGTIEVYSEIGIGTTFKIYFPRVDEEVVKPENAGRRMALPGGKETVLIVEDDDTLRNLCVLILEPLGYRVMQAGNGTEAIAEVQGFGDRIDLLLTDVVMPGMNGSELAMQLVLQHPEMKVLFTSGYTDKTISRQGLLDEGVSFIGKPYTPLALAKKVREVLDEA